MCSIDLEMKIRMIHKSEGGHSLSTIACVHGFAVPTVNTIVKDGAHIKEHVKGMAVMKSVIITKNHEGAISKMEKLLTLGMKAGIFFV
jgi:hypothetical protein